MLIYEDDLLNVEYSDQQGLLSAKWLKCESAEEFIAGITAYKEWFEKILPTNILWDTTNFQYVISGSLQEWIKEFLDKPAVAKKIDFKVAHIVSKDILAQLSVMDIYEDGQAGFMPRFFSHRALATDWIDKNNLVMANNENQLDWKVESFPSTGKAKITLEFDIDQLPDYLYEFRRLLSNRQFILTNYFRYQSLSLREKEILKLITRNFSNKQIAENLFISFETVRTHRKNIIRKLQCKTHTSLMMYRLFI